MLLTFLVHESEWHDRYGVKIDEILEVQLVAKPLFPLGRCLYSRKSEIQRLLEGTNFYYLIGRVLETNMWRGEEEILVECNKIPIRIERCPHAKREVVKANDIIFGSVHLIGAISYDTACIHRTIYGKVLEIKKAICPPISSEKSAEESEEFFLLTIDTTKKKPKKRLSLLAQLARDPTKSDKSLEVENDYTNLSKIVAEGVLTKEESELLRKFNGLRNCFAKAHHYNLLEIGQIEEALGSFDELLELAVKLVRTAENFVE